MRADPERISRLERELLDGAPQRPAPEATESGPDTVERLVALAALSWLVGLPWGIVLTSVGDAAGKPDAVYDHGAAGWVCVVLLAWPFVVVVVGLAGVAVYALIATALGRSL